MTQERRTRTSETGRLRPRRELVVLGIITLLGGCGTKTIEREAEPVHPVRGKVMFNGRPAVKAQVRFHPTDGSSSGRIPSARTLKDGTFRLTTFGDGDSAPPGRYVVTITMRDFEADGETTNVLPTKYAKPDTSDIRVDIKPGDNQLQPFILRG